MPRIRTIKPEFASDEKLASVSRDARLTFVLLMTQADDDGLLLARPRQLLGALYPHDDGVTFADVDGWLTELTQIGAIRRRSTTDDAPVIEIANWSRHQRIDHKSKSLILPHLREYSHEPREDFASHSRDTRAPTVDLRPTTYDRGPTTDDRSGVRNDLPEAARIAFDGIAAGRPSALAAHLRGLHDGMGGPAYPWDVIGRALVEYHANEAGKFSARHFRRFCETAAAPSRTNGRTKHDDTNDAIAEGVRLLNAAGVNYGK